MLMQGTPRGEGAKKVAKLSFEKISALQSELEQERMRAETAEKRALRLEDATEKLEAELKAKEEQVILAEALHGKVSPAIS